MKKHKKTFIGSLLAFFIGTSCCWMSALGIWIGGGTALAIISEYTGKYQFVLLALAAVLLIVGAYQLFLLRKG